MEKFRNSEKVYDFIVEIACDASNTPHTLAKKSKAAAFLQKYHRSPDNEDVI